MTTNGFGIDKLVNLAALQNGLTLATGQVGLFLPMLALDWAKATALSAINIGGPGQMVVQSAVSSFFDVWKTDMIILAKTPTT